MARITKTQAKRKLEAIMSKGASLAMSPQHRGVLTMADYIAIEKICNRALNRLK
jgi:hypothetical protein